MRITRFFKERQEKGRALVLATVIETQGSTYSKAGGTLIIDDEGNFCGMLSGGCLEGDLVERAHDVIGSCAAQTVTYDLGADDELWGLGVGCDGTMRILLQPLLPENDYEPFKAIAAILDGGEPATIAIVVESDSPAVQAGASALLCGDAVHAYGLQEEVVPQIVDAADVDGPSVAKDVDTALGVCSVLYARILRAPSLLVLGAGLDSEPLVRIAAELDWRCTVFDHRPKYVSGRAYPVPTEALCFAVKDLTSNVDLGEFDVAIVMSHHLASDRSYLQQLASSDIAYIGLLGPPGRRDRLMKELGEVSDLLVDRLHGPVGMRLGGRGPGAIALEIVAGVQQYLSQRV